ncbi:MAG TPA: circadian clock KaiB family protein [Terriglobales bacterium]|jgi:circadian clock protein KaiB|nr:circadian clock KaiB family protein [Terriglobales bacterium]
MPKAVRAKNEPQTIRRSLGVAYWLRLYVAGSSLKSSQAIQMVRRVASMFPEGRCKFEVIDLYQEPGLARQDNIIAAPTLVKIEPQPRRAFIGISEDTNRILQKLGIPITVYGSTKTKKR